MRIIPKEELQVILEEHNLWLDSNGEKGKRANLSYSNLCDANLSYSDLSNANLSHAYLFHANLFFADLSHTDLSHAYLSHTDLSYANMFHTDLSNADLSYANLYNIINKKIIIFQADKHFAYYCDGYIKIGCMYMSVKEWIEQYEEIGRENGYTESEIKIYGEWIKLMNNM